MLVGRERELGALNAHYERMLAGEGGALFLTGEAGLGKTTLVREWWMGLRSSKGQVPSSKGGEQHSTKLNDGTTSVELGTWNLEPIFVEAACSIPIGNVDVGRLEALQPWADIIAGLTEQTTRQSATGNRQSRTKPFDLKKLLHDAAPAWAWAIPVVGDIAHAALETTRLVREQRGESEARPVATQQQVFQQYVNLLTHVAEESPLVIFLDDLHWADSSSCNLLFYLARQIAHARILVIATYRHDDAVQANNGAGHPILTVKNEILRYECGTELALHALDRLAIRLLIENMFPGYVPDEKFEAWLGSVSDGNSLFVGQYLKTLRDDGHLDAHGAFTGDYATIAIPPTALAVVEERTRRLDEGTRKLLMYATAEGEEFTAFILERLTGSGPLDLLDRLHVASHQGLVREKGTTRVLANQTTALFGFSHALVHKALYNQLFDAQKALLHRRCFELLKEEWDRLAVNDSRRASLGSKLLTHAERCEEWDAASAVALAMARQSIRNLAHDEALEMSERCIEICRRSGNEARRAGALMAKGFVTMGTSRYDDSAAAYGEARAAFEGLGNESKAVLALCGEAWSAYHRNNYPDAMALAKQALERALAIGDADGESKALNVLGGVCGETGDVERGLEYFRQGLALDERIGNEEGVSKSMCNIGSLYCARGRYDLALEHFQKGLVGLEQAEDLNTTAQVLRSIGTIYHDLGNQEQALAYFNRSLAMYDRVGDRNGYAAALNGIANVHTSRGEHNTAMEIFTRVLAIREAVGDRVGYGAALSNLGHVHYEMGEYERALEYQQRALAVQEAIGYRFGVALSLLNVGADYLALGKHDEARKFLDRARVLAEQVEARPLVGGAYGELGVLERNEARALTGDARRARLASAVANLERAVQVYDETKHDELRTYVEALESTRAELDNDGR